MHVENGVCIRGGVCVLKCKCENVNVYAYEYVCVYVYVYTMCHNVMRCNMI